MASTRAPAVLRRVTASNPTRLILQHRQQRRWAQVQDIRLIATTRAVHNVIGKYRAKLDEKARAEGYSNIEELKEAYKDKIIKMKREAYEDKIMKIKRQGPVSTSNGPAPASSSTPPSAPAPAVLAETASSPTSPQADGPSNPAWTVPGPQGSTKQSGSKQGRAQSRSRSEAYSETEGSGIKPLSTILDMSKARALPPPELKAIWRLRYAHDPQALCAVIPAATYQAMEDLARRCPQFVLPVPRVWNPSSSTGGEKQGAADRNEWEAIMAEGEEAGGGAEIHFLQWVWDAKTKTSTVLFTGLAEFKLRGEFAVPHTTVTHHLDLVDDKGIVLMQGNVAEDRGISPEDAKWLVMCLQRFYGAWEATTATAVDRERMTRAEERRKLLEWFAKGDERFTLDKLMEEAERMG